MQLLQWCPLWRPLLLRRFPGKEGKESWCLDRLPSWYRWSNPLLQENLPECSWRWARDPKLWHHQGWEKPRMLHHCAWGVQHRCLPVWDRRVQLREHVQSVYICHVVSSSARLPDTIETSISWPAGHVTVQIVPRMCKAAKKHTPQHDPSTVGNINKSTKVHKKWKYKH